MTNEKTCKRENQRSNLYIKNNYEPHEQTATTEHQMPTKAQ